MALQFMIGRSGSGKSTALYQYIIEESLKNPRRNYLLLVPDQFTLDTQKMVIGMHPNHGTMNIDILSFHRLAYKIFAELSHEPGVILEDLGKSMILQKILGKRREELPLFGANRDKMGFVDELKSLFSEFYQYGVTQESLQKQMEKEKEGTNLKEKLAELSMIMKDFEEFMGQEYIVAEQLLTVLGNRASESVILKNSVIVLDGFTGFTPVQMTLLERMMPLCVDMYVAVTMDESEVNFRKIYDYELFSSSKETINKLKIIAKEQEVLVKPEWLVFPPTYTVDAGRKDGRGPDRMIVSEVCGEEETWIATEEVSNVYAGRFQLGSELDFLERNLFRTSSKTYEEPTSQITLRNLMDPEEEARFAVQTICRLVKEEGLRYRDIAIISGDMGRYGMRLARLMEEYEIPFFLDDTTGMRSHPLVECIRGVFALFEYDFNYESVCHYVKNGMTDISMEEGDALDNYLLATGLRGFGAFTGKFKRKPRRMSERICGKAEKAREELQEEIRELAPVFRKKRAKVRDYIEALYLYTVKMEYEKKMEQEASRFEEEGDYVFMSAYSQVYGLLIQLFDKIVGILGEEELELSELRKIMDAGLEQMKLGVIPPGPDQVTIGDVERTRLGQLKVLFFLGLNEGIIPKPEQGGGILSDGDREILLSDNFSLAPDVRKKSGLEQFYLYLGLTKPSEKLYLTLASVDQTGTSIRPSYLIGRVERLFPKLTKKEGLDELTQIDTKKSTLPLIRKSLDAWFGGEADVSEETLLQYLFQTEEGEKWIQDALKGRFYTNEEKGLSHEAAKAIYGMSMEGSVTRLETYAGCAFAHFLQYGLVLSARQRYQIQNVDLGQILHKSLELFGKEARERGVGLSFMESEKRDGLAVECLRRAVEEYDPELFHSSARNEACIERLERLMKRTAWAICEQLKTSDFKPAEFEWRFQSRKELEAIRLPLEQGGVMELRGTVDRIDYFEDEENLYVKIVDYKSGMRKFELSDIYNGLSLQLEVYLNAVLEKAAKDQEKNPVPAGIFYFHIQDPIMDREEGKDMSGKLLSAFDMDGLVLAEREAVEHLDFGAEKSIPVSYKKDGTFKATSSVASREQFTALGAYVRNQLIGYGNDIMDGNIAIHPYQEGKKTACDYCDYRGVCGFDPAFAGNKYRKIKKLDKKEIWANIEERR